MPELNYPVQLHEHLTNIPELVAHKILREMTDLFLDDFPRAAVNDAEVSAAIQIIDWYNHAVDDLEIIEQGGIARWISGRTTPRIIATLYGLKVKGITELPL